MSMENGNMIGGASVQDITPEPGADNHRRENNAAFRFSLDDLIPEELKRALEDEETAETLTADPMLTPKEENEGSEERVSSPSPSTIAREEEDGGDDDDDYDISPTSIDNLLKGDLDAIKKKSGEEPGEEAPPFWHDDEEYKELSSTLEEYGLESSKVDALIKKVAEKTSLDNSEAISSIQERLDLAIKEREEASSEFERLRKIERAQNFDSLPEVKDKFISPMQEAMGSIVKVLNKEGVAVPLSKLLSSRNKVEVQNQLGDHNLEDKDLRAILNSWSAYKDLEVEYGIEKEDAQRNGVKASLSQISEESVGKAFKDSLLSMANENRETYGYLGKAMAEGLDKHPKEKAIISQGQQNFFNMVNALRRPGENLRDKSWLHGLNRFFINAEHNRHLSEKLPTVQKERDAAVESLRKVVKEYRRLAGAAKGISGGSSNGFNGMSPLEKREAREEADSLEATAKELEEMLKSPKNFEKNIRL